MFVFLEFLKELERYGIQERRRREKMVFLKTSLWKWMYFIKIFGACGGLIRNNNVNLCPKPMILRMRYCGELQS